MTAGIIVVDKTVEQALGEALGAREGETLLAAAERYRLDNASMHQWPATKWIAVCAIKAGNTPLAAALLGVDMFKKGTPP